MVNEKDFLQFITVKGLSVNSVRLCRIRIKVFNRWLKLYEKEFTKQSTEEFLYELREVKQLNNNSLNTYIFLFQKLKVYLESRGKDASFLNDLTLFKKIHPVITILTAEEIEAILAIEIPYGRNKYITHDPIRTKLANLRYGTFTRFLAMTGCRFTESALLQKRHIDLASGVVTIPPEITKTGKHRRVFIAEPLISQLKQLTKEKKETDIVFTNDLGKHLIPQNYALYLDRVQKATGITKKLHPHIFRHSFATQLIMSGVDVTMVASLLGHQDIQTTYQNYVHLADMSLRKAQFKHPLLRKSLSIKEVLTIVKEAISTSGIDDERFDISLTETNTNLAFSMHYKGL